MDTAASDKIKESFSLDKVAIVGASLNKKEEDTQDVALVIGSPKSEDVIPELYDSTLSIKFSMELVGVENSHALAVPVQVTLPIPSNINPMFLHILHYMQDGSVEEIWPFIYEKDGQYYAQMVLSSFSDFAIVVEKSYVDWDVDTQTGTLTVDVKVDPPTDQASWIVLVAYDEFGKMIDQTMQTLEAGSCQMQLTLSGEALGREGVTAKVIWLDSQFRPLSEAMVYPG